MCKALNSASGQVFFLLWPLFARAPRHWFLENFLLSAPGVQSVFFFVALRWAPRPFGGARAKKKTPPRVFFFAPAPGKGRGRRSPVPARGQSKKKNTTQGVFFFLPRPRGKAMEGEAALGAGTRPEHSGCFFFALAPCRRPTGLLLPLPFAGAAAKKKNTLGGVFFLLWPRAGTGLLLPLPFPGAGAKKNTLQVVFFFLLRPRADAHSLTAGLGGDASPSPGWCLFFFCCSPARTGVVFFFCSGPARTLTHSLWAGAISARPG